MTRAPGTRNLCWRLMALAVAGSCSLLEAPAGGTPSVPGQTVQKGPLTLTPVANAGVLLSSGGTKVLIDALFDQPDPAYRAPAPEVLDNMLKGASPYRDVDLVLVTHNHPDHFDARLAVRYLEAREGPLLVAPADAVAEMRKQAADWARIVSRVVSLDLKVGEKAEQEIGAVRLTAFRTLHGNQESPMNIMYLFDLGGWRVFHEGDSPGVPEEYVAFGLGGARVDLALVHFWFPLDPDCARFLQEVLRAGHIALTHLPVRLEGDAPGKVEAIRGYYRDLRLLLPGTKEATFTAGP